MYEHLTQQYAYNQAKRAIELFDSTLKDEKAPPPEKEYPAIMNARGLFGTYQDFLTRSQVNMTVDILEGLYRNTLMFGIIEKLTEDIVSDGFTVTTGNEKADEFCKTLTKLFRIERLGNSVKDTFIYGSSFDFIQWAKNGTEVLGIREMPVRYTTPKFDGDNNLLGYEFVSNEYFYEPKDVLKMTFARPKGEHFGLPLAMPAAATLELLLNSNTNVGILLDRYAIPIVLWLLSTGKKKDNGTVVKMDPEDLKVFLAELSDFKSGEDIALDATTDFKLITPESSVWNFDGAIDFLNQQFHAICGVPAMMLGYKGDNNAITTRQMQTYYQKNKGLKTVIGEQMASQFFEPLCLAAGHSELDIQVEFPKLEIEERSQKIQWVRPLFQDRVITRKQYAAEFGIKFDQAGVDAEAEIHEQLSNNNVVGQMGGGQQWSQKPENVK